MIDWRTNPDANVLRCYRVWKGDASIRYWATVAKTERAGLRLWRAMFGKSATPTGHERVFA